ncbi:MAG: hypothetical protein KKA67_00390 [Spirochaetes bacterium]|nr:hypothetical protein [Spirochaetota bacterium]MBU1081406.1 hypothetical protein [Spirochaetota bacterium]
MERKQDALMVAIGLMWLAILVMGWNGVWLPAMILSVFLMLAHMALGATHKGKIDKKFFLYPLAAWAALWVASFSLSAYFADVFKGTVPSFTILGFHPSFAWTILTYWIGGILTLSVGLYACRDGWLSEADWEGFKKEIAEIKAQGGKA